MRILLVLSAVLAFTSITFAAGSNPARYFADTGAVDTSTGTDTGAADGGDGTDGTDGSADGTDGSADGTDGSADGTDGSADGTDGSADGTDGSADGTDGSADGTDGSADGADGSADGADGSADGGGEGSTYTGDTAPLDPIVDEAGLTEWKGGGEDGGCSTVPGSSAGVGLALLGLLVGGRRRRSA
jgi:MYXO-CTERM domain-containing protein